MVPSRPRAGYSLVELSIVIALVAVVLGALFTSMQRAQRLFEQLSAASSQDARAGRALARVMSELRESGSGTLWPSLATPPGAPPTWSSTLEFRQAEEWDDDAAAIIWSDVRRFELVDAPGEFSNGVDDDGDGLIDERALALVRNPGAADETRALLSRDVRALFADELANGADDNGNGLVDEAGFCVQRDGQALRVRLCVESHGADGSTILRELEDALVPRN